MIRLGIIGCGLRADRYMGQLASGLGKEWQVDALADPNQTALDIYLKHYCNGDARIFASGPELLEAAGSELDAVIITPPNALHAESVIPAIEKNLTILLEKPVATNVEDCAAIWKAYVEKGRPALAVGFVLRYTAFYRKAREIIDSGAIGRVLTIQAAELLGPMISQCYSRGWRRSDRLAGSFILEKCCHDMDLLGWLAGSTASRVSSFAARTRFVKNPELPVSCTDCKVKDTCRYDADRMRESIRTSGGTPEWYNRVRALLPPDNDLCVFNSDKDVPDHQVLNIEYDNGILATFAAVMDQGKTNRTLRVYGTAGELVGDIGKDELHLHRWADEEWGEHVSEQIELKHDGSGHHGGDSVIGDQFKAMLRGQSVPPDAGLQEGIEGCLVAFAAETSRHEERAVSVSEMRDRVMGRAADS